MDQVPALLAILVFPGLMALAASYDMLTMTIPNWISATLGVVFVAAAALTGMSPELVGMHVLAGLMVLALGFAFFGMGWIGGGDAKLAAAAALWLGWGQLLDYAILFSIFGGLLSLALLMGRQLPLPPVCYRAGWIVRLHDRRTGIPYGIALALAALVVFQQTGWTVHF